MIEAKMLYKNFGASVAVNDVSFTIPDGQITGVLGRPGCGKSTIANILAGYTASSGGSVSINGYDIERHPRRAKAAIGYLPANNPIYYDMTVREYLDFLSRLHRLPRRQVPGRIAWVSDIMGISEYLPHLILNLDRGVIRRIGIAGALINDPPILLLDQPTAGLSPADTREIREILKSLRQDRTMVIFSSYLAEVLELCQHVLVLNGGKRRILSSMESIEDVSAQPGLEEGALDVILESGVDTDLRPQVWAACARENIPILEMKYLNVSLEEIFLQLTGKIQGGGLTDARRIPKRPALSFCKRLVLYVSGRLSLFRRLLFHPLRPCPEHIRGDGDFRQYQRAHGAAVSFFNHALHGAGTADRDG